MDVVAAGSMPVPLLGGAGIADADAPLLTYYDDATGERTELSAAALGGWAAQVAGLLRTGCGLEVGDRAAVLLPPHWQTAAVLFGAWSVGVAVANRGWSTAGLPAVGPGSDEPLDAVFVSTARLGSWLERVPEATHRFVLGLAPGGAPLAEVPDGYRDLVAEVARYPRHLPPSTPVGRGDAASPDGTAFRQWGALAREIAEMNGLRAGDRVLVDATAREQPVFWLLAPLSVGASVVLCANLDRSRLDERMAAERITRVL